MERIKFPPYYCSALCDNAMNDLCMERCKRMSQFKLKKGVTLETAPPFPLDELLHGEVSIDVQVKMGLIYEALAVDFIQGRNGVTNVYSASSPGRPLDVCERHDGRS